ncbi:serine hydrolase [Virgibacillus phasianinus]|uniref:Serine hydrolase n=1 Tax=Virgibacillus phasianinus TaxID=2017483 RepID=A0A220U3D5_9BACI|nr:serine hydrolase [Virgibacillus phasianinus]ASK62555.1 serine hydrolase [Virgibacillus phasianinus]
MKQLIDKIKTITKEAGGTWGISLEDLDTKETWTSNGEQVFTAASVIKVPILIAAFAAFDQKLLVPSDTVELKKEDLVAGSGVLQHMTPGTYFTIYDLLTLMIIQSDNTATNMIIDLLGAEKINQTMEELGLKKSKFFNRLMIVPANREGVNQITALEMTAMLKQLVTGQVVSLYACEQMIDIMKKQQLQDCLPGRLPELESEIIGVPEAWQLAHKTGSVTRVCHDVGIFYVGEKTMIASVLSKGIDDIKAPGLFADIGFEIYHYLKQ